jgi:hypothetical protein
MLLSILSSHSLLEQLEEDWSIPHLVFKFKCYTHWREMYERLDEMHVELLEHVVDGDDDDERVESTMTRGELKCLQQLVPYMMTRPAVKMPSSMSFYNAFKLAQSDVTTIRDKVTCTRSEHWCLDY